MPTIFFSGAHSSHQHNKHIVSYSAFVPIATTALLSAVILGYSVKYILFDYYGRLAYVLCVLGVCLVRVLLLECFVCMYGVCVCVFCTVCECVCVVHLCMLCVCVACASYLCCLLSACV